MEIGCGARIRSFDGRRYFYFWHYEERTDGPRGTRNTSAASTPKRPDPIFCVGWQPTHRKGEQEFARKRARIEGLIAASYTST